MIMKTSHKGAKSRSESGPATLPSDRAGIQAYRAHLSTEIVIYSRGIRN